MITRYLDDLEKHLDETEEQGLYCRWKDFYEGKITEDIFVTERIHKSPSCVKWPEIMINEAIRENGCEKMLVRELKTVADALENGTGAIGCIRANYGTGILPSVFGAGIFYMDDSANTLPTSIPIEGKDKIAEIVARGVPHAKTGLMKKVFEFAAYFREATKSYPKIRKYIHLYHPDFQGPMDVVELLWGSPLFLDVYDSPEMVKNLLALVTDTYIYFMQQWNRVVLPFDRNYSAHWSMLIRGQITLRNDSAMNFSPEMYDEFIRPHDQKIFDAFGGGMIHFCGRGSHYIQRMTGMRNLFAVNLSQPQLNDMDIIYANTIEKDIRIVGFNYDVAKEAQKNGRRFHGKVHCWKQA
jgi:hypothetical protein